MSACHGGCCAAFPYTTDPDTLRKRWEGVRGPLTKKESERKRDDLYIADMLIPLPREDSLDRGEEFDLWKLLGDGGPERFVPAEETQLYTCHHWDHASKLCMAYEERPQMCKDYPYRGECEHGCGYHAPVHTNNQYRAYDVARAAREWEKRKAEDSNPKV